MQVRCLFHVGASQGVFMGIIRLSLGSCFPCLSLKLLWSLFTFSTCLILQATTGCSSTYISLVIVGCSMVTFSMALLNVLLWGELLLHSDRVYLLQQLFSGLLCFLLFRVKVSRLSNGGVICIWDLFHQLDTRAALSWVLWVRQLATHCGKQLETSIFLNIHCETVYFWYWPFPTELVS